NQSTGYGTQVVEHSWWPKQSIWNTAGLNVGYWTQDCEDWFQARVSHLRAGDTQPRTSSRWR
ncbi:hypothetical protein K474DRAFT_1570724, partial [Panus rudis PR-1116 ss-1]